MAEPPPKPLKEWLGIVETAVKILAVPALAIWAIIEFSTEKSLDAKKPFLEAQLQYCTEASSAAALVATTVDDGTLKQALGDFRRLYFGPLVIVEDQAVETAMMTYMTAYESGAPCSELQQHSLEIAKACLGLVQSSWPVLPGQLDATRQALGQREFSKAAASMTCAARP